MLSRTRTGALALIAITTLALALPALGNAAVVQVIGSSLGIGGLTGATNTIDVRYQASGPSEAGALGPRLLVDDKVGINGLGVGCFEVNPGTASCDAGPVTSIAAHLNDGNDVFVIHSAGSEAVPASIPATIRGGAGNDVIKGGSGDDRVLGQEGGDTVAGGPGDDHVSGGPGADGVIGFGGDDLLVGGTGDDALFGQKDRDEFRGGRGRDVLVARDGKPDARIDCGPGSPERAIVDRRDPRPISCDPPKGPKKKRP